MENEKIAETDIDLLKIVEQHNLKYLEAHKKIDKYSLKIVIEEEDESQDY